MPLHVDKYYPLQTGLFIFAAAMWAFIYLQCGAILCFGRLFHLCLLIAHLHLYEAEVFVPLWLALFC